jgi:WhiB family redox-sensing transcriptional regulator
VELPCRRHDPALWFAEAPADLERAKALCAECPIRLACLSVAIDRAEYTGVWGGHIFDRGRIVPRKRPRGRPRKQSSDGAAAARPTPTPEHDMITSIAAVPDPDLDRVHAAAERLYDAECALHVAHQTGVDTWINAANQRLHDAVAEYLAAAGQRPPSTAA